MAEPGPILTVNAGSSSLKLRLLGEDDEVLAENEGRSSDETEALREELRRMLDAG